MPVTHAERFQMFLSLAKARFEIAQSIVSGTIKENNPNLVSVIVPALCDSFLFLCNRADRIALDAATDIKAAGVDVEQFRNFMNDVRKVRNVAEHWGDVVNPRKTFDHSHVLVSGLKISVDETSYVVLRSDHIYSGPLNLYHVYLFVDRITRQLGKS